MSGKLPCLLLDLPRKGRISIVGQEPSCHAEQCFALVEELRISGKHVLDDNFVCAKLDKLRILGGDDFVQMGMWYVNSTRHALVKAQSV